MVERPAGFGTLGSHRHRMVNGAVGLTGPRLGNLYAARGVKRGRVDPGNVHDVV